MRLLGLAAGLLAAAAGTVTARADERITAAYYYRPPYLEPTADGAPTGLTGAPAANAFSRAGIPVSWVLAPTNRQLAMVKDPQQRSCAIGWFRNAEREHFAKFTRPIYRDKDWMLLAYAGYTPPAGATLERILQNSSTRVLVKDNFSYGAEIDAMLARGKQIIVNSTGNNEQMVQSISAGTADFMFAAEEEGAYLISQAGASAKQLRLLRLKDMPHGGERYIMCGKGVPDEVIERLNKAITFR